MDYKFFGLQMSRDKHSVKPRFEQDFWKLLEQKKVWVRAEPLSLFPPHAFIATFIIT